jgi:hypothetical protein
VLDLGNEGPRERLGVGQRHHVAGTLDQRVMCLRHVPPDDLADRAVDGRCPIRDPSTTWTGAVTPGKRLGGEQAAVEEHLIGVVVQAPASRHATAPSR